MVAVVFPCRKRGNHQKKINQNSSLSERLRDSRISKIFFFLLSIEMLYRESLWSTNQRVVVSLHWQCLLFQTRRCVMYHPEILSASLQIWRHFHSKAGMKGKSFGFAFFVLLCFLVLIKSTSVLLTSPLPFCSEEKGNIILLWKCSGEREEVQIPSWRGLL